MEVQKRGRAERRVPQRREQAGIEAAAIAAAAAARAKARRTVEGARSLVAALEARGAPVPAALREASRGALDPDDARGVLKSALRSFSASADVGRRSASTAALASRLSATGHGSGPATSLEAWIEASGAPSDRRLERMEMALAELEAIVGADSIAAFAERYDASAAKLDGGTRALLVDSLVLEMGAVVAAHRADAAVRDRLEAALSGLETIAAPEAAAAAAALRAEARCGDADMPSVSARAEEALAMHGAAQAAAARRRALLASLADLGYEVRPSMTTALAERGRVVVRRPGGGDYGVELAAPGAAERVQVRLVGSASPAAPRDARRDRDAETVWCGDVERLRSLFGAAGGELVVERALGAGIEPVKTVAMEPATEAEYVDVDVAPAGVGKAL